jgi:hypothetical protein
MSEPTYAPVRIVKSSPPKRLVLLVLAGAFGLALLLPGHLAFPCAAPLLALLQ